MGTHVDVGWKTNAYNAGNRLLYIYTNNGQKS